MGSLGVAHFFCLYLLTFYPGLRIFNQMVNISSQRLDATFAALSDPTRRAILTRLAKGQATVTELAKPFRMSLPAISKHLRVLEDTGLIKREIDGRVHHVRLEAKPMKAAAKWMEYYRQFWEERLSALAAYLDDSTSEQNK